MSTSENADAVKIVDYDPRWPQMFRDEAARVRSALGEALVVAVEHVGSTSVPGLAAKPVVDLDVVIASDADLPAAIAGLATLGYVHQGDLGIVGREAFQWPPGATRHHLYVCASGGAELRRHVAFRDHLRAHPDEAAQYALLKRSLAARFPTDIDAYVDGKAGFILAALEKAERDYSRSQGRGDVTDEVKTDEVKIVDYDPRWPGLFTEEAARVRAALGGGLVVAVEHVGSTAVPGLAAKPIIDLIVTVRSLGQAHAEAVPLLEALGYSFWRDNPAPTPLFFVRGLPPNGPRTHHLHMLEADAPDLRHGGLWGRSRLLFRDYLRAHPDEAARYGALKRALAARHRADREAYTDAKTDFIAAVLDRAGRDT